MLQRAKMHPLILSKGKWNPNRESPETESNVVKESTR